MISFTSRGSTDRTRAYLQRLAKLDIRSILESAGHEGVQTLANATPVDSGLARQSWDYEIEVTSSHVSITWLNHDIENGFPVAIMLQYGYGTGTGGYVQGEDYINPAMRPIFDKISNEVWKAVKS